jgi:predicted transposase YbfD/YdcC
MKTRCKVRVSASEQAVLDGVRLRLVREREQKRFDGLLETQHYLKSSALVGERLCYVAEYQGQWLALLTWSAPAYHLKARDEWIGWSDEQRRRRLGWLANNSRFLILDGAHYPNLASRVMKLCLERLNTQQETARQIVQDCGADYVLTVKGNQKGLGETLEQLWNGAHSAFSPSALEVGCGATHGTERPHGSPYRCALCCPP